MIDRWRAAQAVGRLALLSLLAGLGLMGTRPAGRVERRPVG